MGEKKRKGEALRFRSTCLHLKVPNGLNRVHAQRQLCGCSQKAIKIGLRGRGCRGRSQCEERQLLGLRPPALSRILNKNVIPSKSLTFQVRMTSQCSAAGMLGGSASSLNFMVPQYRTKILIAAEREKDLWLETAERTCRTKIGEARRGTRSAVNDTPLLLQERRTCGFQADWRSKRDFETSYAPG
jgi:hypothetical protein